MNLFCKFGWHGKTEERVIWTGSAGVKILADHCARCGHCYVEITPEMRFLMAEQRNLDKYRNYT